MKRLFTLIVIALMTFIIFAQAPQKMSYQAVIRNASGGLVASHVVGMRISILQGSATGTPVYVETHTTTTNANGLATVEIGGGSIVSGTFAGINWGSGTYYLKTETDPAGGTSYTITGTSQLLSVPYALYSRSAANGFTLPYSGSTSSSNFVFSVTNSSAHAIFGKATLTNDFGIGILGEANGPYGIGIAGTGTFAGVQGDGPIGTYGRTDLINNGKGIWGRATAETGNSIGVWGTSESSSGYGVYGVSPKYGTYGKTTGTQGRAVTGEATGTASIGIYGKALNENSTGIWGEGTNQGIYGTSALSTGKGIYGTETSTTGINYGVYGESASESGTGVFGEVSAVAGTSSNYGVYGKCVNGVGVYGEATTTSSIAFGIMGISSGISGAGVFGNGSNNTGSTHGVWGQSYSPSGKGVFGEGRASSGSAYGVYGESYSSSGYGVYSRSPKYGMYGLSTGVQGRAVTGEATGTASIGIYGKALNENSTGVWGEGANYDFYANGPGTNYGSPSSIRWKNNITVIPNPLEMIKAFRGVYFDWNEEHGGIHDVGFIAEEVGKVLPEIVVYEGNGVDASGLDYSKITPLLLEAIKAQQKEIESLRARLGKMEEKIGK